MPDNQAAWVRSRFRGLQTGPAPYTAPGPHEVTLRNRAVSINPIDVMPAVARTVILPWLRYPAVLGSDVAGDVVAVGAAVTRFQVGDRALGHALGVERSQNRAAEGAFQTYTVLQEHMASVLPSATSFEDAATLPLTLSTAACGLFEPQLLGLRLPTASRPLQDEADVVVIWGASTNVGGNAVQLAVNAGYEVIAVASAKARDRILTLGATDVVDRHAVDAVDRIVDLVGKRTLAGCLAIGAGSARACVRIAEHTHGTRRVATASVGPATSLLRVAARRRGVTVGSIWGATLKDNFVGPAIYADYLTEALTNQTHRAPTTPNIVGEGINAVQTGFDSLRRGVSSEKVVVRL